MDNIIFLSENLNYDTKYDVLCYKVYHMLCHGFPSHEGIHSYFLRNINADGFVKIEVLLNIFNNNSNIFKNIFNVLDCSKLCEFDILMVKYNPYFINKIDINKKKVFYIRSKYNHTIEHIKPELISKFQLPIDSLNNLRFFKKIHKDSLNELLVNGIKNNGKKAIVLETQYTQHEYQELENESEIWKTLEIDVKPLMNEFNFYVLDDKVLITNHQNDFSINPSLISIYKHV